MAKPFKELRDKMAPARRESNEQRARELLAHMPLAELRRARELTQQQMAETLKIKQASVSKLNPR